MLQQVIWFAIGFAVAKITGSTVSTEKVKRIAQKCTSAVKEEFAKKEAEEAKEAPQKS